MQRQTLESALAPITAQYKAEQAEAKANANPRAEAPLSFHARERIKMNNDPENRLHKGAILLGNKRMSEFINSAMNSKDKDHSTNFKILKEVYNMDQARVKADFIAQAEEEMDAREYEKNDPAYESNILRKYKPVHNVSVLDMGAYQCFVDKMKQKCHDHGYRFDSKAVAELALTYNLKPNDNDMNLREVKPKQ